MAEPEKKPPSEAVLKANRENAQKSTGPKTEQGKDTSRRNALRHGLRSASFVLIDGEDEAAYNQRKYEWVAGHKPSSPMERYVVEDLVDVSWKLDRCKRFEVARLHEKLRDAPDEFERARAEGLKALVDQLATDPDRASRRLRCSVPGCEWLIEKFTFLLSALVGRGFWLPDERDVVFRLFGRHPQDVFHDAFGVDLCDAYLTTAWHLDKDERFNRGLLGFGPSAGMTERQAEEHWGEKVPECYRGSKPARTLESDADRFFAGAELEALMRGEVERARERIEQLRDRDAWSRAEACDRACVDLSPEGQVLMRYEGGCGGTSTRV